MLIYSLLPVLVFSRSFDFLQQEETETSLSIAINAILEKSSVESNRINVRVYGTDEGFPELKKIMSGNKIVPIKVERNLLKTQNQRTINESTLFLLESLDYLVPCYSHKLWRNFYKTLNFFLYAKGLTAETLEAIGKLDSRARRLRRGRFYDRNEMNHILHLQYFIVDEKSLIKLYTFVWYTQEKCSEPQLIEVNSFDKKRKQWKKSEFVIKKFNNFHGCHLVFGYLTGDVPDNQDAQYLFKFTKELSTSLNFTFETNPVLTADNTSERFYKNPNLTVDLDFIQLQLNFIIKLPGHFHFTQPYFFTPLRLAVPPGEPYDAYEKLILPFDEHVWLLIVFTFIVAFSTILFFQLFSQSVRNFVFGQSVSSPALNVVMIFSGISQAVMPTQNFARFLAMMYIIYSLIIRIRRF